MKIIQYVVNNTKYQGVTGLLITVLRRAFSVRAKSFRICKASISNQVGLEIGGPSDIFRCRGLLPVYSIAKRVDNCNFCTDTVWAGEISEGLNFRYDKKRSPGYHFIRDAIDLAGIPSASYDFVLSSQNIEHIANPLRAIHEWLRILKENGLMILVVPHKDGTFDHRRPVTEIAHIIQDYNSGVDESDTTHLLEILSLHNFKKDPGSGGPAEFKRRGENNIKNRCLHHHAFNTESVIKMLDHAGVEICAVESLRPFFIVAVGKKPANEMIPDNKHWLDGQAVFRYTSPFKSDRVQTK